MNKCNEYNSTESDSEDNSMDETVVDNLPDNSIELRYYVEANTINILRPHQYFVNDTCLYSRKQDQYVQYYLEPIKYMRIPLRLSDNSIVLAEIELLLDLLYQEQKYIDQLMKHVYSKDGSKFYCTTTDDRLCRSELTHEPSDEYDEPSDDEATRLRLEAYQERKRRIEQEVIQTAEERNRKSFLLQRAYRRGNRQILDELDKTDIERMDEDELEKTLLEG